MTERYITLELVKCERDAWQELAKAKMTAEEYESACRSVDRLVNSYKDALEAVKNA